MAHAETIKMVVGYSLVDIDGPDMFVLDLALARLKDDVRDNPGILHTNEQQESLLNLHIEVLKIKAGGLE